MTAVDDRMIRNQALFRYGLRKFLRLMNRQDSVSGTTRRQQELLLGVARLSSLGDATISGLAEFLQERHNSVVGLVDRAELSGLVRRESHPSDRRSVRVALTPRGRAVLADLAFHHLNHVEELNKLLGDVRRAGMEGGWNLRWNDHERNNETDG